MTKTKVIVAVVSVVVIVAGLALYLSVRSKAEVNPDDKVAQAIVSAAKDDLGASSTTSAASDILLDSSLSGTSSSATLTAKYKALPQQITAFKDVAADLKANNISTYLSPSVNSVLYLDTELATSVEEQKTKLNNLSSAAVFSYKTNLDTAYISKLSQAFGIESPEIATDSKTGLIQVGNLAKEGINGEGANYKLLSVNPLTGALQFETLSASYAQATNSSSTPALEVAKTFLSNSALADYAMQINPDLTSTFKNKQDSGVTYVSFHRGWEKSLPIINPLGAFSLSSLSNTIAETLKLPANKQLLPKNENIYATSDGLDGYVRDEGFNTITLAVKNGQVISGQFNMRPLSSGFARVDLISANDALLNLNKGQVFNFTAIPLGEGNPDPDAVFPKDAFESENATITSIFLTYSENSPEFLQKTLQPLYTFKGYAITKSGYPVSFIAQTPAYLDSTQTVKLSSLLIVNADDGTLSDDEVPRGFMGTGSSWTVLPATCQSGKCPRYPSKDNQQKASTSKSDPARETADGILKKLQQGTSGAGEAEQGTADAPGADTGAEKATTGDDPKANDPAKQGKAQDPTDKAGGGASKKPPTGKQPEIAASDVNGEKIIDAGNGRFYRVKIAGGKVDPNNMALIIKKGSGLDDSQKKFNKSEILKKLKEMKVDTSALEAAKTASSTGFGADQTLSGIEGLKESGEYEQHYLGGISPLVYLYSKTPSLFNILPISSTGQITYSYPPKNPNGSWQVIADSRGNLQNGQYGYDRLYYEFSSKAIANPSSGFVVEKQKVAEFLRSDLLPRLSLTAKEQNDYLNDIETHVLQQAPKDTKFYQIYPMTKQEIAALLPLQVRPTPALTIRNFLVFKTLDSQAENVATPNLPSKQNRSNYSSVLVENGCVLLK